MVPCASLYFTRLLYSGPSPVNDIQCQPYSLACFSVNWTAPATANKYSVDLLGNRHADIKVNDSQASAVVCNLTTGGKYSIAVMAMNDACSSISATLQNCTTGKQLYSRVCNKVY